MDRDRRLAQELEEARRWVNDLQSGMYINCVYCGHRYGPKDKVPCTMADALKQHIEQCPKHPMSSLRAELADLKDGLTAAHMDGFASGKAEATEMLRKREGQLEELRAEVKAYREVEDSLQKEIKRLDAEAERLKAAERIRVAGLRETRDALVEKLRAEVGRLKADLLEWKQIAVDCEFSRMDAAHKEITSLRTRAEQAEKELAEYKWRVEKAIEWRNENIINYCPECSLEIDIIDWDALEQILQGTDKRIRVK